jgi:hypothetical protein
MKKLSTTRADSVGSATADSIADYSVTQPAPIPAICKALRELIDSALPKATSKVWHGSPVWFIDDNPVVGYSVTAKKAVCLLFWNGQAFDEPALKPVGKYRAAQALLAAPDEVDAQAIRRWLKKAKSDVFDSQAFFQKMREGSERSQSKDDRRTRNSRRRNRTPQSDRSTS